MALNEPVTF